MCKCSTYVPGSECNNYLLLRARMSNFFAKIKANKRKNKSDLPPQSLDRDSSPSSTAVHPASSPLPEVETLSPTSPPGGPLSVQTSSIFSGLNLSSKVARGEASDSPYVQQDIDKGRDVEGIQSSEEVLGNDHTGENSSFSFLKEESLDEPQDNFDNRPGDGFSFLDQPVLATEDVDASVQDQSLQHVEQTGDTSEYHKSPVLPEENVAPIKLDAESNTPTKTKTSPKHVGSRQTPATGEKKKKRKAIRPGVGVAQGVDKDDFSVSSTPPVELLPASTPPVELLPASTPPVELLPASTPPVELLPDSTPPKESTKLKLDAETEASGNEALTTCKLEAAPGVSNSVGNAAELAHEADETTTELEDPQVETLPLSEELSLTEMLVDNSPPVADSADAPSDSLSKNSKPSVGNYNVQFSHEETLAGLLQSYSSGLTKIRNEFCSVEETHKSEVLEQVGLAEQQAKRWLEDHLLKEKEVRALAEEDYELAEQLNSQLDASGVKLEQDIVSIALCKIDQWVQKCSTQKEIELLFQKEMKEKLDTLREDHSVALQDLKKEHASLLAREKMQMQSLVNKVEREAGHIALDCSHLEKREQLLKEETSRRAVHFIDKKELLVKELAEIQSEIEAYETKLAILRDQKRDVMATITIQEEHIKNVEEELSEERSHLIAERAVLQERQDELSSQQKVMQQRQQAVEEIERQQEKEQHSLEDLVGQSASVWDEVQSAISLQDQSNLQVRQLLDLIEEGGKLLRPSQQLMEARSTMEAKKKEVEEQTGKILTGQNELGEQRRKVQDIQAQQLQLMESKKAAVTGRQFREASRLAGESKAMSLLLEGEQAQLANAEQAMVESSKRLALLSEDLSKVREELSQLEKSEDEDHIQDLLQASSSLGSLSETLGDHFLRNVVDIWNQLYLVIRESLHSKHGLHERTVTRSKETTGPCACEVDSVEDTQVSDELSVKMAELESEIERACQEEQYDKAAELQEKLQSIKMKNQNYS